VTDVSTSKVSDKGLTTIPKEIRSRLGIRKWDLLRWIANQRGTISVRVICDPYAALKGRHTRLQLKYQDLEGQADALLDQLAG
jgi:AbrB family looped-hinge helix DNA binding protein